MRKLKMKCAVQPKRDALTVSAAMGHPDMVHIQINTSISAVKDVMLHRLDVERLVNRLGGWLEKPAVKKKGAK